MFFYIALFTLVILSIFLIILFLRKDRKSKYHSRIKRKADSRERILSRFQFQESNKLLMNPNKDIELYTSDKELDLREKADIHKTRLKKHGKSKLNGKLYFKGPKGGVFVLSDNGNKRYV